MIKKYINSNRKLIISYVDQHYIVVDPKKIAVSTLNHLIFEGHNYLPESFLIEKAKKNLGSEYTVVDVGANIGTVAWQFAKNSKEIYCFEPVPQLYNIIKESAAYNKVNKLKVVNKAVGNVLGVVNMVNNDNSHILKDNGSVLDSISVEVTTLDKDLIEVPKVDLIKIDVEGFEWHVLQGAMSLIRKNRPIFILEIHPVFLEGYGVDYNKILDFLEDEGYVIEYYSFLLELRMNKISRLMSRYFPNHGIKFKNRELFSKDIKKLPSILSYHVYCTYSL
jgi:FkbM family methyltransferase